jgi:hypothetical protein
MGNVMSNFSDFVGGSGGTATDLLSATKDFVNKPLKFTDENSSEWLRQGTLITDAANEYPDAAPLIVKYQTPADGRVAQVARSQNMNFHRNGNTVLGAYYRSDQYQHYYSYGTLKAEDGVSDGYGADGMAVPGSYGGDYRYYGWNYIDVLNAPAGTNSAANVGNKMAMYLRSYYTDSQLKYTDLCIHNLHGYQSDSTFPNGRLDGGATNTVRLQDVNGDDLWTLVGSNLYNATADMWYDPSAHKLYVHRSPLLHVFDFGARSAGHAANQSYNGHMGNGTINAVSSTIDAFGTLDSSVRSGYSGITNDSAFVYMTYSKTVNGANISNIRKLPMATVTDWSTGVDILTDHVNSNTLWKDDVNVTNALSSVVTTAYGLTYFGTESDGTIKLLARSTSSGLYEFSVIGALGSPTNSYGTTMGAARSYLRIK